MRKTVIFGAGYLGRTLYGRIKNCTDVLFFVDNNYKNYEQHILSVLSPDAIIGQDFDVIYIASNAGVDSIYEQLVDELGVPQHKINRLWVDKEFPEKFVLPRVSFLEQFAEYAYARGIDGSCAEVGVFSGDFAREINRVFPDRNLYLFDTFSGFDERDLEVEKNVGENFDGFMKWVTSVQNLKGTSAELVCAKLFYPDKCVIKKGYFPDTFDLKNEKFVLVNLDVDLYQPIKAGLNTFYPIMERGGVILVHDYCGIEGVLLAVNEFIDENNLTAIPVGDYRSVAVIKN